MLPKRGFYLLAIGFAFLSLSPVAANAGSPIKRQDRAWKRYRNEQWGYCVSYPKRWFRGDAFDGAGLFVGTGAEKYSKPTGEIDVAAVPNHLAANSKALSLTLVDDLNMHFDGLRRFERAERMEVLEQRPMTLVDSPALYTRDRYYDPLERATWLEEIVFVRHNGVVYRLELESRADQLSRFDPVFEHVVSTFQFDCAASH